MGPENKGTSSFQEWLIELSGVLSRDDQPTLEEAVTEVGKENIPKGVPYIKDNDGKVIFDRQEDTNDSA